MSKLMHVAKLAIIVGLGAAAVPAFAAPLVAPVPAAGASNLVAVQYYNDGGKMERRVEKDIYNERHHEAKMREAYRLNSYAKMQRRLDKDRYNADHSYYNH